LLNKSNNRLRSTLHLIALNLAELKEEGVTPAIVETNFGYVFNYTMLCLGTTKYMYNEFSFKIT